MIQAIKIKCPKCNNHCRFERNNLDSNTRFQCHQCNNIIANGIIIIEE